MAKRKCEMSAIAEPTDEYEIHVASEAIKKLYRDERTADVYFTFNTKERIPAHKYLLAAASDVFDAMFYGPVKEKGDVKMDDVSVAGFMEFLRFFYFDRIKLTVANIGDVMNLGQKYNVTGCINLCVRFLAENLTIHNIFDVHSFAVVFERDDLKAKCEFLIESHTEELLQSPHFLECDQQNLSLILKLDFSSCSEKVVFEGVMQWLKTASKQSELTKEIVKTHLGDLFNEIRFRSMSHNDFSDLLPSYGKLFSADELCEILQMIRNEDYQAKIFNGLRRTPITTMTLPWNKHAVMRCDRLLRVVSEPCRVHASETTIFSTNQPLLLGYFMCSPICDNNRGNRIKPLMANVTISRVQQGNEYPTLTRSVLHTMNAVLTGDNNKNLMNLPKPIIIRPKFKYEIQFNIDISGEYATFRELKSEVQLPGDITVTFHNDVLVSGKNRGLIYELGFNRVN